MAYCYDPNGYDSEAFSVGGVGGQAVYGLMSVQTSAGFNGLARLQLDIIMAEYQVSRLSYA